VFQIERRINFRLRKKCFARNFSTQFWENKNPGFALRVAGDELLAGSGKLTHHLRFAGATPVPRSEPR
jgi:hypothetical protein